VVKRILGAVLTKPDVTESNFLKTKEDVTTKKN
jgi:hypothetical protein